LARVKAPADFRAPSNCQRKTPIQRGTMKKEYDFSNARRGALIPSPGKTRITIRIDDDILDWFRKQIEKACGGSYQTMMNDALRAYMASKDGHAEELIRKVLREELATYTVKKARKK
jgi:uncharacterized protein (DUF4415 family)